ncbi:MAG: MgtC/SapB family protein [Coriobacteriales bacterium]|nr:MgtC/SapB family protein [Coriobacteriales bacterium]
MELFAGLRTFTFGAIALRLLGALLCGAMVGVDREMRNKKAGLKTHALVCLGAALCMIVSECIILGREGVTTDATRIAANVVTGVGFLCAASLITRGNGSLHGLTTAAGLWTTAVIGLACGSGWLEVGLLTALIVLIVFAVFGRLDAYLTGISRGFDLYAEVIDYEDLPKLLDALHAHDVTFSGLTVSKSPVGTTVVQLSATMRRLGEKKALAESLRALDCVRYLEMF